MSATSTRLRKAVCEECGYTIRVTRSWLTVGLPSCPCGGQIRPTDPADLIMLGLVTNPDELPPGEWTKACRENNWDELIPRKGAARNAYELRQLGVNGREKPQAPTYAPAETCVYPGCGLWVKRGAERCAHDHPQRELAAIPF